MDVLTHTAVGLFLSRAGLKRWTPMAAPVLLLAANAPDIDILAAAGGSLSYLHFHRHLTHSLLAMPVLALLSVAVVRMVTRKPVNWLGAFFAALIAVAAHLALDLTNVYGVRLFLPFSDAWLHWDLTSVVDLWVWLALFICLAAPFISRLVGSEISSGNERRQNHGRGFAIAALAFLLLYNCGRNALHTQALAALNSRLYRNAVPDRVEALPDPANPLTWRGLVETGTFVAEADMNLAREFDPGQAAIFYKPDAEPALAAASKAPAIREFLRFAQFPFWSAMPADGPEGARLVEVYDLRFGTPSAPGFRAGAVVDPSGRIVRDSFGFGALRPH
jgi:inner membrane protein